MRRLLRFLGSRPLAVAVLVLLAGVVFLSGLLTATRFARMSDGIDDPVSGRRTGGSPLEVWVTMSWFHLVLAVFGANLLVCSGRRLRQRFLHSGQLAAQPHFRLIATGLPGEAACLMIEEELRQRRYRIHRRTLGGERLIFAARTPFGRFASLLVHLSLVIVPGAYWATNESRKSGEVVLFPEQSENIAIAPAETLQLQLISTASEYEKLDTAGAYRLRSRYSSLVLYRNQRFLRTDSLSTVRSVRIGNTALYQGKSVPVFVIRVQRTGSGSEKHYGVMSTRNSPTGADTTMYLREGQLFSLGTHRYRTGTARPGRMRLGDPRTQHLPLYVPLLPVRTDSGGIDAGRAETLGMEKPLRLRNYQLRLLNIRQGTVIRYCSDSGYPWFLVAGVLFLLGMALRCLLPGYEFHAAVVEEEGETVVRMGGRALGPVSLRPLVNRLQDRLS